MNRKLLVFAVAAFVAALLQAPRQANAIQEGEYPGKGCDQECKDMYSCQYSSQYQVCITPALSPCEVGACS